MDNQIKIDGKARTLRALEGSLKCADVLPQVTFNVRQWHLYRDKCIQDIEKELGLESLIIRSSAASEDTKKGSLAGHFETIMNISGKNRLNIAIDQVVMSLGGNNPDKDEVLIQPMLENITCSGVAFSADPNTCAPYRVINYVEGSNAAAVTSGKDALTYVQAAHSIFCAPNSMKPIIKLINELEALFPNVPLDIEFAVLEDPKKIMLLQVRPLVLRKDMENAKDQKQRLDEIEQKVKNGFRPHPLLHGRKTIYGIMPDWNPAEIIGIRPRPLALSLYKELITDNIWAYQRSNYGYKNLRSFPLLQNFHGLPYIDTRVSFNSFIPRDINTNLGEKLVDYYIDRLLAAPSLHDKIEFEIVFSCYSLDLPERLRTLDGAGFSKAEQTQLSNSLRRLTNRMINKKTGLWRTDWGKLEVLIQRREQVLESDMDPISQIYWLLEDCKRYGTLPFAGLARAGFVAVEILKSMVTVGIMDELDYDAFMGDLTMGSSQLIHDHSNLEDHKLLAKYGHLRPGTYNILSPRYDEAPDIYFNFNDTSKKKPASNRKAPLFSLNHQQLHDLKVLLKEHGLDTDVTGLFKFLEAGITLREHAKFLFTKNLSDALSLIGKVGEGMGFSLEDLSYADINVFYQMHGSGGDHKALLENNIKQGYQRYEITSKIWLPPLLSEIKDVWGFHLTASEPNFITQKTVTARVTSKTNKEFLAGAIIAIPNADPGFDWLLSFPIAGLITAYGGPNSHMAIRSGELGLPAIIGAGENLFNKWSLAQLLSIDCACKRVEILL